MAEETTTTFLLNSVVDSPDIVLRRFQRCIVLDRQQNDDRDIGRDLAFKLSSLRESYCEKEIAVDRLKARYGKLLSEVEEQEEELHRLCKWKESLTNQLENLLHRDEDVVNRIKATDDEVSRVRDRVQIYEKTFGIKIVRTKEHGNIQIVFRGCCEDDYNLPSYASLRFDSGAAKAQIVKCSPPITDIEELVDHFNNFGDFRSFLLILRHRFVRYFQLRKKADCDCKRTH